MWQSLFGTVTLEIVSADNVDVLDRLRKWNITISELSYPDELTLRITVSRADYRAVTHILKKRGCKITVLHHNGIYWQLKDLLHRPILTFGVLFYLILVLTVPGKVFFVEVEGNTSIPTRMILEAAQDSGIYFGVNRREVRSERVKNALLEKIPQLQWAGVNTNGCVAVISVRERQETAVKEENPMGSIVATQDGIIRQITVIKGTQLCTVGQAVKAGQILVSGYKDYGISIKLTGAEGEVFAQTQRKLEALTPASVLLRTNPGGVEKKYSLIIGKKQINFFKDSGISHTSCVKMYKKTYLVLPGGFTLPVALVKQETVFYDTEAFRLEDFSFMESVCRKYLNGVMRGGTILREESNIEVFDDVCRFTAGYSCQEQIGLIKEEELTDHNE